MGINIERDGHFLTHLYVKASQTVSSKHTKHHLSWVSIMCFKNKVLCFPLTAG